MTFLDELKTVLDTLNAQRVRTLLTLLGIILGVGTLVALSSAVEGAGQFMQRGMQQATGEDVLTISRTWKRKNKGAPNLNRFDSRALQQAPALSDATVLNQHTDRVYYGTRWQERIYVVGTTPEALAFYGLEVARGRFLGQADLTSRLPVVILGSDTPSKLLPGVKDPLGQEVKLKGERFRVVGILKPKPKFGGGMRTWNGSVIVSEPAFLDRFARDRELREIVVKAPESALETLGIGRLSHVAKSILLWRHYGVENFTITDPEKEAQSRQIVGLIVGGLELAIAGICLGVGGINIMNIMLVTVTQRTREIGIRRALGATRNSIRRQFLTEAAILAAVGGILGVVGGTVFAWLLSIGLTAAFGHWPFVFMPMQALLGLTFAVVTGVAFGWYPAHRAANLSPIDCLRYE